MLVFAPAACIMAGMLFLELLMFSHAQSKFQLPGLLGYSDVSVILAFLLVHVLGVLCIVSGLHHTPADGVVINTKTSKEDRRKDRDIKSGKTPIHGFVETSECISKMK